MNPKIEKLPFHVVSPADMKQLEGNAQMSRMQIHTQFSLANTSFGCALCQHTPTDLVPCKHIPVQISPKHVICRYFLEYWIPILNVLCQIMADAEEMIDRP